MRYDVTHDGYPRQRLTFGEFASLITTDEENKIRKLKVGEVYKRSSIVPSTVKLTVRRVA